MARFPSYNVDLQCVGLRMHHGASLLAMDTLVGKMVVYRVLSFQWMVSAHGGGLFQAVGVGGVGGLFEAGFC
jgi:hypothetical protein